MDKVNERNDAPLLLGLLLAFVGPAAIILGIAFYTGTEAFVTFLLSPLCLMQVCFCMCVSMYVCVLILVVAFYKPLLYCLCLCLM